MAVGAQGGPRSLANPPRPMDHQASAVAEQTPPVIVAAIINNAGKADVAGGGAGEDVCSSSTRLHDEAPAWKHGRLSTPGTSPRATSERPGQPCWELDPKAEPLVVGMVWGLRRVGRPGIATSCTCGPGQTSCHLEGPAWKVGSPHTFLEAVLTCSPSPSDTWPAGVSGGWAAGRTQVCSQQVCVTPAGHPASLGLSFPSLRWAKTCLCV